MDFDLLLMLDFFEPFGHKNPRPLFEFKNVRVKSAKTLGKEGRHLRLVLGDENTTVQAVFFDFDTEIKSGENISFIANVDKNEFFGTPTPQLIIKNLTL